MSRKPYIETVPNECCGKPTTICQNPVETISTNVPTCYIDLAQGLKDRLPKSKILRELHKTHIALTEELESLSEQLEIRTSYRSITGVSNYDKFFGKVLSNVMSTRDRDNIREMNHLLTEENSDSFSIRISAVLFAKLYSDGNKAPFEREKTILKDNKISSIESDIKNLKIEIQKLKTRLTKRTRRRIEHHKPACEQETRHNRCDNYKRRHVANKLEEFAKGSEMSRKDVVKIEPDLNTIQELHFNGFSENAPIEIDEIPEDQIEQMMKNITKVHVKANKEIGVLGKPFPIFRSFDRSTENEIQKEKSLNVRKPGFIGSGCNIDIPEKERDNAHNSLFPNEKVRDASAGKRGYGINFSIFKGERKLIAKPQDVLSERESPTIIYKNQPNLNSNTKTADMNSYETLNRSGMLPRLLVLHKGDRPIFRGPLSDSGSSTDDTGGTDSTAAPAMDQHFS